METPSLTNNTSDGVSSRHSAIGIDTKSFVYGFLICLVLCSPCVFYTVRRLLQIIKTKIYESGRIIVPNPDESFLLLSNQDIITRNVEEENKTDGLLELGISRNSLNLNLLTEEYSELNSDEESGICELSSNASTSDICNMRETAHPAACEISLSDERKSTKLSKCIDVETISKELKETDLKLTAPVNRTNTDEKTDLQQSPDNEQALALRESLSSIRACEISLSDERKSTQLSKCIGVETISKELKETDLKLTSPVNRTNTDEKTDLQQSADNEQALALRESHSSIKDDQERGINWDLVFQKSADLVIPSEHYQFFITLFGTVGINNAGRIIDEVVTNNPHKIKTAIIKLFLRWREHAGNENIELHIENTFKELGWNSNFEDFRKIMSNPPLTQTNLPLVQAGHSASLSLDFPMNDIDNESTNVLAHQQDEKLETQTITRNGVTRKIVRKRTSEIIHEYQCVRGGNSEAKILKHKLESPCDKHIDKMSIPNKSRKISENLESGEHIVYKRNDDQCEKTESTNNFIIENNNNPFQNKEVKETQVRSNRNYKNGKSPKSTTLLAKYRDRQQKSRRQKYWKGSDSLQSYLKDTKCTCCANHLYVSENGNLVTPSDKILQSTKWNKNKTRRRISTGDLYQRGQISSTKSSELPIDSGYSSSRSETGLYRVDEESQSSYVCHIVKLIERLLASKLPIDKYDYDLYQKNIIKRITTRFQTEEQVLELKLDELKNKNKGYFLLSGDRLLGFSEDDCNSLELYVENARSTICNSSETDIVFINYDGVPLKDVA